MAETTRNTFKEVHEHTAVSTPVNSFRFITYNILADLYAFRDIEDYSPYCSPEHLEFNYRQTRLIEELKGYNSDILCLQEVDEKAYNGKLTLELKATGLESFYIKKRGKHGELTEGSALYFRTSKFRLVQQYGESIIRILETEPYCSDIKQWAYSKQIWKDIVEVQPHTVQIAMLEWLEHPNTVLIVCNTHLLWDESNPQVRYIQVLVTIRLLEQFVQKYKTQNPRVMYCGDFNSRPEEEVIKYVLNNKHYMAGQGNIVNVCGTDVDADCFSHRFLFGNACGVRPYTSLTKTFKGQLDYIFYDLDLLEVTKVIPQLDDMTVTRHTALPNVEIPSDHLPQICEFQVKT